MRKLRIHHGGDPEPWAASAASWPANSQPSPGLPPLPPPPHPPARPPDPARGRGRVAAAPLLTRPQPFPAPGARRAPPHTAFGRRARVHRS
eukprot:7162172-Alexandrium_andersonii.AAC.1